MNPIYKVKKNKKLVSSSVVVCILVCSMFAGLFIIGSEHIKSSANEYNYYKQLTIESDYISEDLTNFPVLVHIDEDEDMYEKVLSNLSDIAFFDSTQTVQFYHEVEYYSIGGGVVDADVWVNVTSISASVDTIFYLYYGDSDGGYPTSYYPEYVWDSNFMMVHHMNGSQDTNCLDSTVNNNNVDDDYGTPDYQQTGKVGYAVNFVDESSEGLGISDSNSLDITTAGTVETWVKPTTITPSACIGGKYDYDLGDERSYTIGHLTSSEPRIQASDDGTSGGIETSSTTDKLVAGSWAYIAGLYDGSNLYMKINLSSFEDSTALTGIHSGDADFGIGCEISGGTAGSAFDGLIDEFRVSNVCRNDSWLNATYYTISLPSLFITFGEQNSVGSETTLTPSSTTHQGEQGNTTYSNESGTAYTWLMWNLSDGTEYLRINITNMPSNITSANFTYQFTSDNSSWNKGGNWKSGSAGGWSFNINNSTWVAGNGCYGSNPYTIDDDSDTIYETDGWTEIWCVERCTIPTGIGNETYTDSAGTKPTWDSGRYS